MVARIVKRHRDRLGTTEAEVIVRFASFVGATAIPFAIFVGCANGEAEESDPGASVDPNTPLDASVSETSPRRPPSGSNDAATGDVSPVEPQETDNGCRCGNPNCGPCPSSPMVAAGGYRIDSTEVTREDYAAFLTARKTRSQFVGTCAGHAVVPTDAWPPKSDEGKLAVTHIDWCAAASYCRWAGKELCGSTAGGTNGYTAFQSQNSAWFNACSAGGSRAYPYGNAYQPTTCNGADAERRRVAPTEESTACVGGYPNLFNMSGNVWEWEDSCLRDGAHTVCRIRGGSFENNGASLGCAADAALSIESVAANVGFRCCSSD